MIEREKGWEKEKNKKTVMLGERETKPQREKEKENKVGETERKKNDRQCGLWEIERELQIER